MLPKGVVMSLSAERTPKKAITTRCSGFRVPKFVPKAPKKWPPSEEMILT